MECEGVGLQANTCLNKSTTLFCSVTDRAHLSLENFYALFRQWEYFKEVIV